MLSLHDTYVNIQAQYQVEDTLMQAALLLLVLPCSASDRDIVHVPIRADTEDVALVDADGICSLCGPEEDDIPFANDEAPACVHVLAAALFRAMHAEDPTPPIRLVPEPAEQRIRQLEPHSMTVKAWNTHGLEWLICVRAHGVDALFEDAKTVAGKIKEHGWMSFEAYQAYRNSKKEVPERQKKTQEAHDTVENDEPASSVHVQNNEPARSMQQPQARALVPGAKTFHATYITANLLNDRWIWAVFGNDMPHYNAKYGMRVWPETLTDAGFNVQELEKLLDNGTREHPAQLPNVHGWLAEYVEKTGEDGKTKPDKVIALRQP